MQESLTTKDNSFQHATFYSCAIEELKMKTMNKPKKYTERSCFIATAKQIEEARQRELEIRASLKATKNDHK